MKTLTLAVAIIAALLIITPATEAQINTLGAIATDETAKKQRMYDIIFDDCLDYLRKTIADAKRAGESGNPMMAGTATQIFSLRGLLNLEIYKMCRELKGDK